MTDILQRLRCTVPCADMTAKAGCHCAEARDEIMRLRAEVEKLRAALELFACDCIESGNLCPSPQNCRNYIARAALEEK